VATTTVHLLMATDAAGQAIITVEGDLPAVLAKLQPGVWTDFVEDGNTVLVNPAHVTHARRTAT